MGLAIDPPGKIRPLAARHSSPPLNSGNWAGRSGACSPRWAKALCGEHAAARGARDEALLQQIGLDDFLDGVARLGQRRGDGLDADRAAAVIHGDAAQIAMIERVEPARVNLELRRARGRRSWHRPRPNLPRKQNRARAVAAGPPPAACRARAVRSHARPLRVSGRLSSRAPRRTISSSSGTP